MMMRISVVNVFYSIFCNNKKIKMQRHEQVWEERESEIEREERKIVI